MYMSEKLFKNKDLTAQEKIAIAYILKGHYRQKYLPLDRAAKDLYMSESAASRLFKKLEEKGLIKWPRVEGHKYKIIIVSQECFNKFDFITDINELKENRLTKDNYINSLSDLEKGKQLLIFKLDKKKGKVTPSWYDDYKKGVEKPADEISESQKEQMEALIKTMF